MSSGDATIDILVDVMILLLLILILILMLILYMYLCMDTTRRVEVGLGVNPSSTWESDVSGQGTGDVTRSYPWLTAQVASILN